MEILEFFVKHWAGVIVGAFICGLIVLVAYMEHRFQGRMYEIQASISGALDEHVTVEEFLNFLKTGEIEIRWTSREIIE